MDLKRYHDVGPRLLPARRNCRTQQGSGFQGQKYREYRCGGQLVKGKRCRDYEYLRGQGAN